VDYWNRAALRVVGPCLDGQEEMKEEKT
jgi:hypothetical protein